MNTELQTLWALAGGEFPVLSADDYDGVHHRYGPAFGPWRSAAVGYGEDRPLALLGVSGAVDDVAAALRCVAADWRTLSDDDPENRRVAACPDEPTAADVALRAPYGLLVRHGLVRLWGYAQASTTQLTYG